MLVVVLAFATSAGRATVFAQTGTATSSATPSNTTPSIGEQIVVTITIDVSNVAAPDDRLGSYTGSLDWDPVVLAYNTDSGPMAGFTGLVNTTNAATGHIVFNGASASGATGNVTVLTITLDVIGAGTSALNLEYSAMAATATFTNLLPILTVTDGQVEALTPTETPVAPTPTLTPSPTPTGYWLYLPILIKTMPPPQGHPPVPGALGWSSAAPYRP